MSSAWISASAALLTIAAPASAQGGPAVADFIATVGGDTSMATIGSLRTRPSPEVGPLLRNRNEIADYRFIAEKLTKDGSATAMRARTAFANECAAKGGALEPDDGPVAQKFASRTIGKGKLPERGGDKHFWTGMSAVCSAGADRVLGGFVAVVYDTTAVSSGGGLLGRLMPAIPTNTAVYAYHGAGIDSRAAIAREEARLAAERQAELEQQAAFRRDLTIGAETSCGTVIQLRGPMVELAMGGNRLTPSGQSTFWSKRDDIFPKGAKDCNYGN